MEILGIDIVQLLNSFVEIKWQIVSIPLSSPINFELWNTAVPKVSILGESEIGVSPATYALSDFIFEFSSLEVFE